MAIAGAVSMSGWDGPPDLMRSLRAMAIGSQAPRLTHFDNASFGSCDDAWHGEFRSRDDLYIALFDGRLDNREQLASALGMAEQRVPDVEIIVRAYERWGDDFLDRLIGDFACALWDSTRRRLALGRDALGARPLHVWLGSGMVIFASEPGGLLAQPAVPRSIDEAWVARWLALLPQDDTSTFHSGIERIPQGHVLFIDSAGTRLHRYWRPENLSPLKLSSDADYTEALRGLLDEAIACRIKTSKGIGIGMSGGLDSTSIAVLAAAQLSELGRRLTAFTAVPSKDFDHGLYPNEICDEGPLAASVVALHDNMDHVLIQNDATSLFDALDTGSALMNEPIRNPFAQVWGNALLRAAGERGIGVLLVGDMGNMTISYDGSFLLARLCREGRLGRLAAELTALSRNGYPLLPLLNGTIGPLLPTGIRRGLRRLLGRAEVGLYDFSAINPIFAKRLGMEEEAMEIAGNMANTTDGKHGDPRLRVLLRYDRAAAINRGRRLAGVERTDPTADRRVVEFCLAIPQEQFLRGGMQRSLIRRVMAGSLPAPLLQERRKGLQAADWYRVATAARPEMLAELARLERNAFARSCLDLPRLRRYAEDWPTDGWHRPDVARHYQNLLARGVSLGRFIRRFEGGND